MIREMISKLMKGDDLTRTEAEQVMSEIMDGQATPAQIAAYLVALRLKGETIDEVTGSVVVMREKAAHVDAGDGTIIDTCGTGGDHFGTFNISTATALVLAGAGLKVAKHGNRAASSRSGSADVLAELGVNIEASLPVVERCLREADIGFLFAVMCHKSMKHAIGPRRELGVRTIFNILGPLTNPAGAQRQILGVFDSELTGLMAAVLRNLGSVHACIVHGHDGMDEVTTCDATTVAELVGGEIKCYEVTPEDLELPRAKIEDLQVDGVTESAAVISDVLAGKPGPARDIVLANAAFGLLAGDVVGSPVEGVKAAAEALDTARAQAALEKLVEVSNSPTN